MNRPSGSLTCVFVLLSFFSLAPSALAVNYVTNGDFESNLSGWLNELPGTSRPVTWLSLDANGYSSSGSMHIAVTDSIASQGALMTQCTAVSGGSMYDLVLRFRIAPGQGVVGHAYAAVMFFNAPSCGGQQAGGQNRTWDAVSSAFSFGSIMRVFAPAGTQSAKIILTVQKAAGAPFAAEFDDVSLYPNQGNLLANPHFDSGTTGWGLTTAASVTLTPTEFDGGGSSVAGGMIFRNSSSSAGAAGPAVWQCLGVVPGVSYDAGARMLVPGGQQQHGQIRMILFFYPGEGCNGGSFLSYGGPPAVADASGRYNAAAATVIAPENARSVFFSIQAHKTEAEGSFSALADDAYFAASGGCVPDANTLCLNNDRFRVRATYEAPGGASGDAHVVQLTSDSGYLWFFSESNIEAIIKVLNACGINVKYWSFAGGLTNVKVVTTVTDTLTGESKTYTNQQGTPFQPLQDTGAFSTCP